MHEVLKSVRPQPFSRNILQLSAVLSCMVLCSAGFARAEGRWTLASRPSHRFLASAFPNRLRLVALRSCAGADPQTDRNTDLSQPDPLGSQRATRILRARWTRVGACLGQTGRAARQGTCRHADDSSVRRGARIGDRCCVVDLAHHRAIARRALAAAGG